MKGMLLALHKRFWLAKSSLTRGKCRQLHNGLPARG
jgi:hypothetical protein